MLSESWSNALGDLYKRLVNERIKMLGSSSSKIGGVFVSCCVNKSFVVGSKSTIFEAILPLEVVAVIITEIGTAEVNVR